MKKTTLTIETETGYARFTGLNSKEGQKALQKYIKMLHREKRPVVWHYGIPSDTVLQRVAESEHEQAIASYNTQGV